jgi:predicted nucleic acid-binding protein
LAQALESGAPVVTTGLILQELLQGFRGPRSRERIVEHFAALPLVVPDRRDHIDAAELRTACRRRGVQVGTIDALLAQLCLRYSLTMLTIDRDFGAITRVRPFTLWAP